MLGTAASVSTLVFLWEAWWSGPAVDSWHFVNVLVAHEQGSDLWRRLAKNHGGHRPFFPRLLLLADYAWFGGRNVFVLVWGVVLQLSTWWALVWAAQRESMNIGRSAVAFAAGLVLALCFCATQLENFARAWNVHWFLVSAVVAWSLVALAAAGAAQTRRAVVVGTAVAVLLAGVATWSMANGVLVWGLLVFTALWLRLPLPVPAAILVAGALVAWSFQSGYMPGRGVHVAALWAAPLSRVIWVVRCLGAPLSWWHPNAGAVLGAAGLVTFLLAAAHAARRRPRPADVVCLGVAAFWMGSAFLVAWGRTAYSGESWGTPRYQTLSLLFWASLLTWLVVRIGSGPVALGVRAVMLVGVATLLIPSHFAQGARVGTFAERVRAAHLALVVGVSDRSAYQATLPFSDRKRRRDAAKRHAGFLRGRQLGMFHDGRHTLLGRQLDVLHPQRSEACEGGIFRSADSASKRWVRVDGWAREVGSVRVPDLIFTDPMGRVIGLGEPLRHPLFGAEDAAPHFVAWRHAAPAGEVWAVLGDGSACRVAAWGRA